MVTTVVTPIYGYSMHKATKDPIIKISPNAFILNPSSLSRYVFMLCCIDLEYFIYTIFNMPLSHISVVPDDDSVLMIVPSTNFNVHTPAFFHS